MTKGIITLFFILVLALSFVASIETQISVRTVPGCNVTVTAFSKSTGEFVEFGRKKGLSDELGFYNVSFDTGKNQFGMHVYITQNNKEIFSERFPEDFQSGNLTIVIATPSWYNISLIDQTNNQEQELISTVTEEKVISTEEQNKTQQISITGNQVLTEKILTKQNIYLALGIILAIAVIWIIIWFIRRPKSEEYEMKKVQSKINSIVGEIELVKKKKSAQRENLSKELEHLEKMEEDLKKEVSFPETKQQSASSNQVNGHK